jgi:hypothetical protein
MVLGQSAASKVYCVGGYEGFVGDHHVGLDKLLTTMGTDGLHLLKSKSNGDIYGPDGLIAKDDLVLIKINCQWGQRGGTNTDLVKYLIQTIVQHQDGFVGEIVVVDNGQGRGQFDWPEANAEDTTQSIQDVVDSFGNQNISTFLWDNIRSRNVKEYDQGSLDDGYVSESIPDPYTNMRFNYPKFRTRSGTYVSLKKGIWDPDSATFSNERMKLINFPVLKSHSGAGVTACIKHYMGFVSQSIQDNHSYIWNGGLAAEMAQIRFPTLNILDAIYVNPHPAESQNSGPDTPYPRAFKANRIFASLDPVALDYWATRNVLLSITRALGYTSYTSMNPDDSRGIFNQYLTNSMNTLHQNGRQATMNPSEIIVHTSFPKINDNVSNFISVPQESTCFIYPNYTGSKPSGVYPAQLSDWTATGYLIGMCLNSQLETTDTTPTIIDAKTGDLKLRDKTIVLFGGPLVHSAVYFYEKSRIAPAYWGIENYTNYWYRFDGTRIDATAMPSSQVGKNQDMFIVESFNDGNSNRVLIIYGYGWRGTFAGGKFFKFIIYPNIDAYTMSYYVFKWTDQNGDGFVDLDEISTTPMAAG